MISCEAIHPAKYFSVKLPVPLVGRLGFRQTASASRTRRCYRRHGLHLGPRLRAFIDAGNDLRCRQNPVAENICSNHPGAYDPPQLDAISAPCLAVALKPRGRRSRLAAERDGLLDAYAARGRTGRLVVRTVLARMLTRPVHRRAEPRREASRQVTGSAISSREDAATSPAHQ